MNKQISAVIITLNEEKNIGRCLDSLQGVVDEIVIVDSFSTDKTEDICKAKGARFVQHKFDGHIEQKNWAITQANYPIVLSLDADEALSKKLAAEIRIIKSNWEYDGYIFNRLTNYCGKWIKHGDWYPDAKLRLWDSRKGHWTGKNPHDRFVLTEGKTKRIKKDILHYSYYTISEHIKQVNYFTDISAKAYFLAGKRSSIFKIFFSPIFKFFSSYFLRFGFLDGYLGFVQTVISANETFLKYVKLKEIQDKEK